MKHTIIFSLLLCSLSAFSQRTPLTDTSFITNQGGRFFENRLITYSTGESSNVVTLVGDTAAVQTLYRNAVSIEGRQLGAAIAIVRNRVAIQNTIRRISATCKTATNLSVDQLTANARASQWLGETLTFTTSTGTQSATVTRVADGTFRLTIGTDAARIIQIYEDASIRIQGYPSGSSVTYLFNIGDNRTFSDFSGANVLTRTNALR